MSSWYDITFNVIFHQLSQISLIFALIVLIKPQWNCTNWEYFSRIILKNMNICEAC